MHEPVLDEHLVAALFNLPRLEFLALTISHYSLLPHLGSLPAIQTLSIRACLLEGKHADINACELAQCIYHCS
jgi:hypothetical protein